MPLTTDELESIDSSANTKADLKEKLSDYEDEYPTFRQIDPDDQKRSEMLDTAREAIEAELDRQGKIDAIETLMQEEPDAVIVPIRQALLTLVNPKDTDERFTMSVFEDYSMGQRESYREPPEDPVQDTPVEQLDVATTPLSAAPKWAMPEIFDLHRAGDIRIFPTPDAAKAATQQQVKTTEEPILDDPSKEVKFHLSREDGFGNQEGQIVSEAGGKFARPEQRAAFNVLNKKSSDGQNPLPDSPSEVSTDPNDLTDAEVARTERRIKAGLQNPSKFARKADKTSFDARTYFDQLLECEMNGFNAPRKGGEKIGGVMRPQIVQLIRAIAREHGFEVAGSYVKDRPDSTLSEEGRVPDTVPMTDPADRKNERGGFNETLVGNRRVDQSHLG